MPLVGFRPTKARLVMEHARPSVVVLKVALDDDGVALDTGESLGELAGVLRIREARGDGHGQSNGHANGHAPSHGHGVAHGSAHGNGNGNGRIGSLTYVPASGDGAAAAPAKYQVEVTMDADKFAALLRSANAGRMPTRFMVDAGGPAAGGGLGYRMRAQGREKLWDTTDHRVLAITHFVMILPLDLSDDAPAATGPAHVPAPPPAEPVSGATNAQVAEMMDDMLTFQSDTRNTMFGLVLVLGIVALAALALGVATLFR